MISSSSLSRTLVKRCSTSFNRAAASLQGRRVWATSASLAAAGTCYWYSVTVPLHAEVTPAPQKATGPPPEAVLCQSLLASISPVSTGAITPGASGSLTFLLRSASTNLTSNSSRTFLHTLKLDASGEWSNVGVFPSEMKDVLVYSPSPSGKRLATVRSVPAAGDKRSQFLEIWENGTLVVSLQLDDAHSAVNTDPMFGRFSWNRDENAVVYAAEPNPPEVSTYFAKKAVSSGRGEANDHKHREDWGEQLVGVKSPKVYVATFREAATATVSRLSGRPEGVSNDNFSAGMPVFTPDGKHVVYMAMNNEPFRRGLMFCTNRNSSMFVAPLAADDKDNTTVHLRVSSHDQMNVIQPLFTPSGSHLLYITTNEGAAHRGGYTLNAVAWKAEEGIADVSTHCTVVDTVSSPKTNEFPGLYPEAGFPRGCWNAGKEHNLLLNCMWRSRETIARIDTQTGSVTDVGALAIRAINAATGQSYSNAHLLDSDVNGMLIRVESPVLVPKVVYIRHCAVGGTSSLNNAAGSTPPPISVLPDNVLSTVSDPKIRELINGLEWELFPVTPSLPASSPAPFEAFLVKPKRKPGSPLPRLLVYPHGGPHVCNTTMFSIMTTLLCSTNSAVLFVNYRGSTGFGEGSLHALLGRAGELDVSDVADATREVLRREPPVVDSARVGIVGGSHGGFLAAHGVGQHPELYKAAVLANPVLNIAAMFSFTDIPDWCQAEAGTLSRLTGGMTRSEEVVKMYKASPIAHVDKVTAPTLIVLGLKDLRVPPLQGLEFYRELAARGVPTKLLTFPNDNHSLRTPLTLADYMVSTTKWFVEHLPEKENSNE